MSAENAEHTSVVPSHKEVLRFLRYISSFLEHSQKFNQTHHVHIAMEPAISIKRNCKTGEHVICVQENTTPQLHYSRANLT